MKKFNLLLIGNANHQYIIIFTKWLQKRFPNISISIITTNPDVNLNFLKNVYEEIYTLPENSKFISKFKGIRTIAKGWKIYEILLKYKLKPNTILVHYATPWLAFSGFLLRKKTQNYIISLWGSDFYRATPRFYLNLNLMHVDKIIISSPQMIKDFSGKYRKYSNKVNLCYFGNEIIEFINNIHSKQDSLEYLKLTSDKINITIGHNGSKSHQHIQVINSLLKLDIVVLNRIRLIFPMTYAVNSEYLEEIKKTCNYLNIERIFYTEFMSEIDVAHLRNVTDIMINVQTTDAFSGSMKEVLYCGGIVINGSWLPYQFLKDLGIYFEEVNAVADLWEKVNEIISDYSQLKEKCIPNATLIRDLCSWDQVINDWKEVIEYQR